MEQVDSRSTDGRSCRATGVDSAAARSRGSCDVALVHHFHAEAGTVQHVGPGVQDAALTIKDGLVEVEAVQVEGHG